MTHPLLVPPCGPAVMGQEAYDAEVARLTTLYGGSGGGGGFGPRVIGEAAVAVPQPTPPAEESLSYSEALALLEKAPEELARVVALELARVPGPRKSVLQVAARKARAAVNDELLTKIEAALEALH